METNMAESEDLFAESNGIQENRRLQDKGTAKPILQIRRRISYLVEPKTYTEGRHPQSLRC